MAHAENTVTITRPIQVVFDFLADGTNNPLWRPAVIEIQPVANAGKAGATYAQKLKGPGGRPISGDYQVIAFEPPSHLSFRVTSGPARPEGTYRLTEVGAGNTSVHFCLELTTRGMLKIMEPMIKRTMASEVACLANLKQVLEYGPGN
ncbi:MAG: hypothetical protein NVSMB17_00280 [Candidatus Dormibacteria bacterium]